MLNIGIYRWSTGKEFPKRKPTQVAWNGNKSVIPPPRFISFFAEGGGPPIVERSSYSVAPPFLIFGMVERDMKLSVQHRAN